MKGLTLVPDLHAAPGHTFTFIGPNTGGECEGCPVQKMCFDLSPGTKYRVDAIRTVVHPCNLHEGGMRVVEASPIAFETTLETKHLRGTAATFNAIDCALPECSHWKLCHPVGIAQGVRYPIDQVLEDVDCPARYSIKRVKLGPLA